MTNNQPHGRGQPAPHARRSRGRKTLTDHRPEIVALIDLSITASRGRSLAAKALIRAFAEVAEDSDASTNQKVLLAKICAEEVGALEDLGALACAIADRERGVLKTYLDYQPKAVKRLYEAIQAGKPLERVLGFPPLTDLPISGRERARMRRAFSGLQATFVAAASNYLGLNLGIIHIYNRIKHGFAVVQRVDFITPGATLPSDWQQHTHVLTGVRSDGLIKFASIERTEGMLDSLLRVIEMCSGGWKELAAILIRLEELGVPLPPPTGAKPSLAE